MTFLAWSYWIAILFRLFLLAKLDFSASVEVSTPINSHSRLVEGVFLRQNESNRDPYSGVVFHETPLILEGMRLLMTKSPKFINNFWICIDLTTALIIGFIGKEVAKRLLREQESEAKHVHVESKILLLKREEVERYSTYAQLFFLFNPYILVNLVAKTTTSVDNLILAGFLLCMLRKQVIPSCLCLALATYKGFYPFMLLSPLCLIMAEDLPRPSTSRILYRVVTPVLVIFTAFWLGLMWVSYELMDKSWSFVWSTYGFILSVPELTPNMGLFWYIFTEMFEHFRVFFVWTFQLNAFVYLIPLTIRLRKDPFLLAFSLIALTAIFKSYPSFGDFGFYLALLPMLGYLVPFTKQLLIVALMVIVTTVLGPILYHLWIYNGSANANYFFAMNCVYGTAQIFLVTDLLFAYVRREFYLFNGVSSAKGKGMKLVMK